MLVSTLAVCDTEPIAIEGLRGFLDSNNGPRIVCTHSVIEEGVFAVNELRPALLIVDRGFGGQAVMDWIRKLRAEQPPTMAIIWGSPISEYEALRFVQAGAKGVIRKS